MIHENTFKKVDFNGAKGLVFTGDKILVYRRDNKTSNSPLCIDLPGGGREGNESPFESFKREIREEFGIDVEKDEIEFSCTIPSVIEPDKKSYFIVAKTLKFKPEDVVFGNEGIEWMLMKPEEFIKRPDGIERQQKRVEKYLAGKMVSE
ncbi:MAG: NUDIX domain-containing protein [bacterium]